MHLPHICACATHLHARGYRSPAPFYLRRRVGRAPYPPSEHDGGACTHPHPRRRGDHDGHGRARGVQLMCFLMCTPMHNHPRSILLDGRREVCRMCVVSLRAPMKLSCRWLEQLPWPHSLPHSYRDPQIRDQHVSIMWDTLLDDDVWTTIARMAM